MCLGDLGHLFSKPGLTHASFTEDVDQVCAPSSNRGLDAAHELQVFDVTSNKRRSFAPWATSGRGGFGHSEVDVHRLVATA